MSSYCSIVYLVMFLPVAMVLYNITPQKHRWKTLLIISYAFFWAISGKLIIYLLISTFSIHHFGLWIDSTINERKSVLKETEKEEKKAVKALYQKKVSSIITLAVVIHIGALALLKYSPFFLSNINSLLSLLHINILIPIPKFLVPIGISFYTLEAVSYLFDVSNGKIKADKNLGRLALYLAFFPQTMEGPISRYSETAMQLWEGNSITYKSITMGLQRILYGLFKKVIIADRLNILIKEVFGNFTDYGGVITAIAMVSYTCQLYMEFSGTMDVIIGSGEIFGVKLPENFKRPFFSKTISDFWTRWHITLGAWFRDYIFYPVTMSKPMKKLTINARKRMGNHFGPLVAGSIALFSVWLCNGLWHGAGWKYIFFGMFHFTFILLGNIFDPYIQKLADKLHINRASTPYMCLQIVKTTILVNFGELFFRADGLKAGFIMVKKIFTDFDLKAVSVKSILDLGLDEMDFLIIALALVVVITISILQEKGVKVRESLATKKIGVRWALTYALLFSIIIFGAYGTGYVPIDPIYAGF